MIWLSFFSFKESIRLMFPMKAKEKTVLSLSITGAGLGLFILAPLVIYLFQLMHNSLPLSVSWKYPHMAGWSWNFVLVASGATAGLIIGYLYSVCRVKKYQIAEIKHCLELVINSMGEKISIVDENYKIILCNNTYAQSLSSSAAKLIGTYYQRDLISSDNNDDLVKEKSCLVKKTFATGKPQSGIDRKIIAGKLVIIEKKLYPMKDNAGNVICGVIIENDITRERKLEESLRQSQKMEAIGTLAGGIAHDFNNILSAVIGYADLGLLVTSPQDKVNKYFQSIFKAGVRGKDLTEQILAFSRKKPVHKEPVIVGQIVAEALKLLRASLPTTIKIQTKLVAHDARIMADATQIHQIIMNLCTNANYAIGQKSGVMGIGLNKKKIGPHEAGKVEGLEPGNYLQLTVSDTGRGIEEAVLPKIFDPFFTTKRDREGTGMGLAVVHGITKSCGGSIIVKSKPGKGTAFYLLFPLFDEDILAQGKQKITTGKLARGKGKIMVVDDEKDLTMMLEEMLHFLGYQVESVTSSLDALEYFQQNSADYDLVITDYTMPEKTGFELAGDMLACRADIPIILTTGYTDTITPQDAFDLGITDFLLKPLQLQQVAETVKSAISIH